jgi:hypothetical protein
MGCLKSRADLEDHDCGNHGYALIKRAMPGARNNLETQTRLSAPAITQLIITLITANFLGYTIYFGLTDESMRNWIVASHWGRIAEQTLATLVISTIASIGLWRRVRWAWFLALALDLTVLGKCAYEIAWEDWNIWGHGREFTNTQDSVAGVIFFSGVMVLLLPPVIRTTFRD